MKIVGTDLFRVDSFDTLTAARLSFTFSRIFLEQLGWKAPTTFLAEPLPIVKHQRRSLAGTNAFIFSASFFLRARFSTGTTFIHWPFVIWSKSFSAQSQRVRKSTSRLEWERTAGGNSDSTSHGSHLLISWRRCCLRKLPSQVVGGRRTSIGHRSGRTFNLFFFFWLLTSELQTNSRRTFVHSKWDR